MINNSSECWALPCNSSDFKLTLEMTTSAIVVNFGQGFGRLVVFRLLKNLHRSTWRILSSGDNFLVRVIAYIDLLKNVDAWMNFAVICQNVVVWMMA